jgi:hypothetical protein
MLSRQRCTVRLCRENYGAALSAEELSRTAVRIREDDGTVYPRQHCAKAGIRYS